VGFALGAALSFALMLHLTVHWLKDIDGRVRTFLTMSVAAVIMLIVGAATDAVALPRASAGWIGLALLCVFYASAIITLFIVLPRIDAVNNAMVLNSEPIMVLGLAWLVLDQAVAPRQIVGAFVVVGAIVYLSSAKR
jgi:drug/metabolite transporter (DMT)-like permease